MAVGAAKMTEAANKTFGGKSEMSSKPSEGKAKAKTKPKAHKSNVISVERRGIFQQFV